MLNRRVLLGNLLAAANTRTQPRDEIDNAMDGMMWNMVRTAGWAWAATTSQESVGSLLGL